MAEPKKKRSKTRTRRARANDRRSLPALVACRQCAAEIMPHTVCSSCGSYGPVPNSTS
ncbi:50S ribosomal protein L32 [Candidatus Berkelbacteria bacterium]|nr:50S ribosomal protein L32 [Candidatus Berkelbacteria bacterium]